MVKLYREAKGDHYYERLVFKRLNYIPTNLLFRSYFLIHENIPQLLHEI